MTKPPHHHIAKVRDAIVVKKSAGLPHYRPDIAAWTGLSMRQVNAVLDYWDRQAMATPKGRQTISSWTEMRGDKGGLATTLPERHRAASQRGKTRQSQAEHDAQRLEAEYRRAPHDDVWAMNWAKAARQVSKESFADARDAIDDLHMRALLDACPSPLTTEDSLASFKVHLELLQEIDAL